MMSAAATGPLIREGQRHLAQWTLQPLAAMIAEECTTKLGEPVKLDIMQPLQAFDAGGRARAFSAMIGAMAVAKGAGIEASEVEKALALVNWDQTRPRNSQ